MLELHNKKIDGKTSATILNLVLFNVHNCILRFGDYPL